MHIFHNHSWKLRFIWRNLHFFHDYLTKFEIFCYLLRKFAFVRDPRTKSVFIYYYYFVFQSFVKVCFFFCDHLMKLEIFNVNYWGKLFFSATMCRNLQYFLCLSFRTDDQFFFNFGTGCLKILGKFGKESPLLQILTWNVWNYHD